jgi:hypothetical protein
MVGMGDHVLGYQKQLIQEREIKSNQNHIIKELIQK